MVPGAFANQISLLAHGLNALALKRGAARRVDGRVRSYVYQYGVNIRQNRLQYGGFLRVWPDNGAGSGNRTRIASLEGWSFTTKLYPRRDCLSIYPRQGLLQTVVGVGQGFP